MQHLLLTTVLLLLFATRGDAQALPVDPRSGTPDFRMQIWGDAVTDFNARVNQYFDLRNTLEVGLGTWTISDDPGSIRKAQFALARRIRVARRDAGEGAIFTPAMRVEFKRVLLLSMDARTWAVIMDENPGAFRHRINGDYPDGKSFSSVPANILALLPELPDDIQFRFLGRHLILYDLRAHVILDRIPYAIQCADCEDR